MAILSYDKRPRRVAVVGGGVSGIACLWGLRNEDYDVHLFEADSRLGGHANTVPFENDGCSVLVDTGFIAMNETSYPQFTAFLNDLNVETIPTDMSFGVSEDNGVFEWGSTSFGSFVGKFSQLFSPWFWRLVFDIVRFNYFATDILSESWQSHSYSTKKAERNRLYQNAELESIGDYLDRQGYSEQFKRYYIIPMVAAPWCIDPEEFSRNFPAHTLIRFMSDKSLLDTFLKRLHWRTVKNGSKSYVDAFLARLPSRHQIHLNAAIKSCVRRGNGQVRLVTFAGSTEDFDHVVLAVHANQALTILGEGASSTEREILRQFHTSSNVCVLHNDMSLMPHRPNARASWNCLMQSSGKPDRDIPNQRNRGLINGEKDLLREMKYASKISVTFDMNRLQQIPSPGEPGSPGRVLVSMNPIHEPKSMKGRYYYRHPLFSSASISASKRLHEINGIANVSFAGAWMGFGFHEDGFAAGSHAARDFIGISSDCTKSRAVLELINMDQWLPRWGSIDRINRNMIRAVQWWINVATAAGGSRIKI